MLLLTIIFQFVSEKEPYFTLRFHHGGHFETIEDQMYYFGGKVDHFDFCDPDEISMLDVRDMVQNLGHHGHIDYFWGKSECNLIDGLTQFTTDKDVLKFTKSIDEHRIIEIYVNHKTHNATSQVSGHDAHNRAKGRSQNQIYGDVDFFYDSDYDLSDDDVLFETHVDHGVELDNFWEGITQRRQINADDDVESEDSDYAPSDELRCEDKDDDDDDDDDGKKVNYPEFNEEPDMMNPNLVKGMLFASFDQFKKACRMHALRNKGNILFPYNDLVRVEAVCTDEKCKFRVWASRKSRTVTTIQIKRCQATPTCSGVTKIKTATAEFLAKYYLEDFKVNSEWNIDHFIQKVGQDWYTEITKDKTWRTRRLARQIIEGREKEQYKKLNSYCHEILSRNAGSTCILYLDNLSFKRIYVCLKACKEGFKDCRPLISLDGCFLKGRYGGQLLAAVGIDANDCIFPLAYAVVESETRDRWGWFLELLASDLSIENN